MRPPSPFTPTFVPFRPIEPGWVAYHDLEPAVGFPGLAMTWRGTDGMLRYVAALGFERDGHVLDNGTLSEQQDLTEVMSRSSLRDRRPKAIEEHLLALLLPSPGNGGAGPLSNGLPPVEAHADAARRAVAAATLPDPMRAAFASCIDKGHPRRFSFRELRRKSRSPVWQAVEMAVSQPGLARLVLSHAPSLMAEADPMAAVRRHWPGLTEAHFRLLRSEEGDLFAQRAGATLGGPVLDLLEACPVDWWPRRDAWVQFFRNAQVLKSIRHACPEQLSMRRLASASKGDWAPFESRLVRAAAVANTGRLRDRAFDCRDPVESLTKTVILPLLANFGGDDTVAHLTDFDPVRDLDTIVGPAFSAAGLLLYGDKTAASILETSREWHVRREAMDSRMRGAGGSVSWPALFQGEFRVGEVGVVCVGDLEALREEGASGPDRNGVAGLDHCVATRLTSCLSGAAHILSVRSHAADGSWSRLSTCQVSVHADADGLPSVDVVEHRGPENEEPDEAAHEAVARLVDALEEGRLAASAEATTRHRVPSGSGLALMCGYDWRDPDAIAAAISAWQPFLPRWARDLAPEALYGTLVGGGLLPGREATPAPEATFAP